MSLTSMLRIPEVHEKFKTTFPKPKFQVKQDIIAPPLTTNYPIVGQAFDYFLRFHLKQKFPESIYGDERWIAELGLETLKLNNFDLRLYKEAKLIVDSAKKAYSDFLITGNNSSELAEYCILLAKIDLFFRTGDRAAPHTIQELRDIDERDTKDLLNLISIVPFDQFKPEIGMMTNPTFGFGSQIVGGADVDLILDNTIIDIKTTKNLKLVPNDWYQIIGYHILYDIDILDAMVSMRRVPYPGAPKIFIDKVGIYFSRHGYLFTTEIDPIDPKTREKFIDWLKDKGDELYGWRNQRKEN